MIFRKNVKRPVAKDLSNLTLIGKTSGKKEVYVSDNAKHFFTCGTTGSGKTVFLANFVWSLFEKDYPGLIIDGKGDTGNNSMLDIINNINHKFSNKKKVYVIDLNNPQFSDKYNPFKNATPTVAKDMLINMTEWSEEHYKLNTERYVQRLIKMVYLLDENLSFRNIVKYMEPNKFMKLSSSLLKSELITKDEHIENISLIENSGKIVNGAYARFSTIIESDIGTIFDDNGIDVYTAIKEKAIILFILNPLIYPELSPLMGRTVIIDSKKAISRLFHKNISRSFFIFDEINVYASRPFLDLINKSRSANVTCVLAAQSLSDLTSAVDEAFQEQIIENCNNYIVLRQNSSQNAENWSKILGTRQTMEVTYQLQQKGFNTGETGFGSAKRVREFLYHPDDIKTLKTGQAVYLSKDTNYHARIHVNNHLSL